MSSFVISLLVELMVCGLLAATIAYCVLLNRRLERLRSDEQALKATIAELVTATEIAERAIQGLKVTVRECDTTLGERLRSAEQFIAEIDREVKSGQEVVKRISRITAAARAATAREAAETEGAHEAGVMPGQANAASTLAAATAFAARVSARAA
ncbi:hypothetical protein BN1110_04154 [bacterium YEK0313]|nr:hypothetical protein BN1110_04154 [bacterium YEK0313]